MSKPNRVFFERENSEHILQEAREYVINDLFGISANNFIHSRISKDPYIGWKSEVPTSNGTNALGRARLSLSKVEAKNKYMLDRELIVNDKMKLLLLFDRPLHATPIERDNRYRGTWKRVKTGV